MVWLIIINIKKRECNTITTCNNAMPNWCFSSYVIEGNKEEIADLYLKMKSLEERETSLVENGFGKNWLGNVVTILGGNWNEVHCRGEFYNLEIYDNIIVFSTETAWSEMTETWDFVCSRYNSLKYYFSAEESGCEYYVTNDKEAKHFPDRFLLVDFECGSEYYNNEKSLFEAIKDRVGYTVQSIEEAEKALEKYNETVNEDNQVFAHEFAVVEQEYTGVDGYPCNARIDGEGDGDRVFLEYADKRLLNYGNEFSAPSCELQNLKSRWLDEGTGEEQFQIYYNNTWCNAQSIDFDFE